jgi:hypothetical protein
MDHKIVMAKSKKPICIAVSVAKMLLLGACAGGQLNAGSGSFASVSASPKPQSQYLLCSK